MGPARIRVPDWETWGGGGGSWGRWRCLRSSLPISAPKISCKKTWCDEWEKVLELIKAAESCPTKGFLPLFCFSKHY